MWGSRGSLVLEFAYVITSSGLAWNNGDAVMDNNAKDKRYPANQTNAILITQILQITANSAGSFWWGC